MSYALFLSEFTGSSTCLLHCCIVAYLLPYAGTDEGPRIILAPNIEDPVAGDAAEGTAVAGDAAQAAAVAGDAAEGDACPADPDEDIDEDADQVVVNSQTTWFLASNTYHYGNFDLLWIQIDGDRHSNAPAQFQDGIRLSTYSSLWCHVFTRHPFNLGPEEEDPVDDPVWIRQDRLHVLSVFLGINNPIFHQQPCYDVAKAGPSAGQGMSLLQRDCVFAAYHRAHPYTLHPVPDWSRIHINGGAPAIGSQLIYQPSYYNEWEAPM
jgi:hypothetical protein